MVGLDCPGPDRIFNDGNSNTVSDQNSIFLKASTDFSDVISSAQHTCHVS